MVANHEPTRGEPQPNGLGHNELSTISYAYVCVAAVRADRMVGTSRRAAECPAINDNVCATVSVITHGASKGCTRPDRKGRVFKIGSRRSGNRHTRFYLCEGSRGTDRGAQARDAGNGKEL